MNSRKSHIIIVEPSYIISEGITSILSESNIAIHTAASLVEFQQRALLDKPAIALINPICIQNQIKEFQFIKKELPETKWIGIIYNVIDQQQLSLFDGLLYINDNPEKIIELIQKLQQNKDIPNIEQQQETLSDREIDVLKLLVNGNANKEIADKLNISTSTVITHRKNISYKTGIKSVSGLTIYAVVNNIITIDYFPK